MISLLSHNGIFHLGEFTAYIYILKDIHGLQRDFAQKPVHYFCPAATRNPGAYLSHFPLLSRRKKQIDRHSQSPIMAIKNKLIHFRSKNIINPSNLFKDKS